MLNKQGLLTSARHWEEYNDETISKRDCHALWARNDSSWWFLM
jgi:hypothetical protein